MNSIKNIITQLMYPNKMMERFWKHRDKYNFADNKISKYFHYRYCRKVMDLGCSFLPMTAEIDGRLILPHGLSGIFISKGAKIGKNCTVFHQVTIGSNTLPETKNYGSPTVGDNVYIGAGAKIIGSIKIGNNVRIGANCVVVMDIPDNATVVLPKPAILVHDKPKNNDFVDFDNR